MKALLAVYFGALASTAALVAAACLLINGLVDPLWYFNGNVLTGANYAFNERIAKIVRFLPRMAEYDCVLFGSSHSALLNVDQTAGHRCFNMAFSHGRIGEFILYARYLRDRGLRPALIILNVDLFDFQEDGPPNVPDFIRDEGAPPTVLRSYLSLDALDFSLRTLRRKFPNRLVYDRDFHMHIIPRRRYRPPVAPAVAPPFHAGLAETFVDLRRTFPEARAIGFAPPTAAWYVGQLKVNGQLDAWLGALERISRAFDEFLDFGVPSAVTMSTTNSYDGGHYKDDVNAATAAALSSGRTDTGADWIHEPVAEIRARYEAGLAEMAQAPDRPRAAQ